MKNRIVMTLGALALLGSAASMAASVEVIPGSTAGSGTGCCNYQLSHPNNFFVILHATGFAGDGTTTGTVGASLVIEFNPAVVNVTGIALVAGSPIDTISGPTPQDASHVLISAFRNASGYAFGSFDLVRVNFSTVGNGLAGIVVIDDHVDNSWVDQDANIISNVTYTDANVTVAAPVPAAVWMLVSALGSLAGIRRLRRA